MNIPPPRWRYTFLAYRLSGGHNTNPVESLKLKIIMKAVKESSL